MLMTMFEEGINALTLVGNNYAFSKSGCGDAEAEHKRHDSAEEKFHKAKDKWSKNRMK